MQVDGEARMQENAERCSATWRRRRCSRTASNLAAQAKTFHKSAREDKRHMCSRTRR